MFVSLFVTNKLGPLRSASRVIHILNQHGPGGALVYSSLALIIC